MLLVSVILSKGEYNGPVCIGRILVQIACFLQFFGSQVAFIPPFLSESADEWLFQELIHGNLQFLSQFSCRLTDVPAMHVDGSHAAYVRKSYWI